MSGHSKWATIKHQKGQADVRRGLLFSKLSREIMLAARQGGGNPDGNIRLRLTIQKARDSNMPMDNIERAIKRALGQGEGQAQLEEILYEGYGPSGVAIMVQVVTDNRNRTASDLRAIFTRNGVSLGQSGSVSWQFESMGVITVEADTPEKAEETALTAIDLGAKDFLQDGSFLEIRTSIEAFESLRKAMESKGVKVSTAEISQVPKATVTLDEDAAERTLRFLDRLEEMDDVQKVYTNADFPDAALERYKTAA